jgi:hypothetical protein
MPERLSIKPFLMPFHTSAPKLSPIPLPAREIYAFFYDI